MPKRIMPLTDLQVKNAKPKGKNYKLSDGGGLYLLITPTGGKLWRYNYRFDGKEKTLFLKTYPEKSLNAARKDREEARQLLTNGVDPSAVVKAIKEQEQVQKAIDTNTFEKIARQWHEHKRNKWSENHAERLLHRLEIDVFPTIGSKPIVEIERSELVNELRRISARTVETAIRVKAAFYGIFRFALDGGLIKNNPAADLKDIVPRVVHKHMAAPTEPKKVAELVKAIDGFSGSYVTLCALKLTPMLFVRPGELRSMEWSELDLNAAEWNTAATTLPAPRAEIFLEWAIWYGR